MRHTVLFPVLVAVSVAACGSRGEPVPPSDRAPVQVTTAVARTQPVAETFEVGGSVRSRTVAVLSSRIVAPVLAVNVRAGDRVRAGQPIVVLDQRDLHAAALQADAALAAARENANAAAAEERAAASALVLATATHKRISALRERNSATPAELDDAVAALDAARARVSGSAARALGSRSAIEAAEAAARASAVAQSYGTITAPFDGLVTARSVDPGNLATPGLPLVTVEDPERFRIEVTVDASRGISIVAGARVPVSVDGVTGQLDGAIAEVSQSVDPVTHMFTVKIDLPGVAGLRSGLFGRARLSGAAQPMLAVPSSAVQRRGQLAMVFVEESGVARMRMIHAGAATESLVTVLAGLSDGEQIIVNPVPDMTDGTRVTTTGRRP